ncbi:hypothetical protein [Alkalilimnicola ehrlichii]|uniref:hypothetical protein n=1 Tax=Alkalilimnicola ehrlichii TaxID=351052 RepID=UPI003B9E6551
MSDTLRFDWEWLAYPELPAEEAVTFADLTIRLNDKAMTRLYDVAAKTERDNLFAAAYPLAQFLAENWWRIRWEPAPASLSNAGPQWRLAHNIAAAGAGYVWPNITFHGDGERMFMHVGPHTSESSAVQFVSEGNGVLDAAMFEAETDRFMEGVLARLQACGHPETELEQLWRAVQAERSSNEDCERRRLEAMAGFDPDEAPEAMLDELLQLEQRLGVSAIRELAAASRANTLDHVRILEEALCARGLRYQVPDTSRMRIEWPAPPWRRAVEVARAARQAWGLNDGPLDNTQLAAIVDLPRDQLDSSAPEAVPYSASLRGGEEGDRLVFRTGHRHGRRFAIGRLMGDAFYSPGEGGALAAATDARTGRQKFQRAFAQELLCPFEALSDFLNLGQDWDASDDTPPPNEDRIEEAAEYFDVSPVLVQSTLVNHNVLPRDVLEITDAA